MQIVDSYSLIGPNRRSEKTVVEVWIQLSDAEMQLVDAHATEFRANVLDHLSELGISCSTEPLSPDGSGARQYAAIFCHAALALQEHAGHAVQFQATYPGRTDDTSTFAVEYEHRQACLEALQLANLLLEDLIPGIRLEQDENPQLQSFEQELKRYLEAAPARLLPRHTQDIIDAAKRLDIPWVKLDRDPYEGLVGDFRVRPNAMLKLGQACNQRVIDGSFPIDAGEGIAQLVHDRAMARGALESLGASLPAAMACNNLQQAETAVEQIGFPVIVKPRRINRSRVFGQISGPLHGNSELSESVLVALQACGGAIIEAAVPGQSYKALLGNGALLGIFALRENLAAEVVTDQVHEATRAWLTGASRKLGVPLLTITLVSENIALPLEQEGYVVGMDVAPELDDFLPPGGAFPSASIRQQAAESLLRNLFPEGQPARVPLISVTGTNGKSTVCTMISRIMQHQGYEVGRAGTTGIYHNDDQLESGDFGGGKGHHRVLESTGVNLAVLETARGAVSGLGLSFDLSDVAVCTNVSEDHLGERGIDTVEQMAELKLFIVNRARNTVVLNADNPYSAGMLPHLQGRHAWLVSDQLSLVELRERFGDEARFCTTETIDGKEWISLHDHTATIPVIAVNDIPATFNGLARFNVSNAMQAVAASFATGASIDNISKALSGYVTDYKTSPGRLNVYEELPFKVIFDFAHNEDCHRVIRQIIDKENPPGRKIICFSRRGNTLDEHVLAMTAMVAGGYDYYICFENPYQFWRKHMEVPSILKKGLIQNGVDESDICTVDTHEAMQTALDMSREGDLLLFCTTTPHIERDWSELTGYRKDS